MPELNTLNVCAEVSHFGEIERSRSVTLESIDGSRQT
jgi:hypothetical protein